MKLHILFGQRKEVYEGQYAPEALVCWDEYSIEDNGAGFEAECEEQRKKYGSDFEAMRVILIDVDGDRIRKILVGSPAVRGSIV